MRRISACVALIVVAMLTVLAGGLSAQVEPIRIGVCEPMTGAMAAGGQMTWEGILLAHEMTPEVLGRPIRLFLADNKSDPVESANAVAKLIDQDKVIAIIGSYGSSNSMAGGDVAEKAGIPMITDSATNPLVTEGKDYMFRACFIDPFQGEVMAKYAYGEGIRKVAILIDVAQDYSVGLANYFEATFKQLTGDARSVVAKVAYNTGDQDFSAQLTQVINSGAEALFVPGYFGDMALVAKQLRALGSKILLMGGDAIDAPELVIIGGEAAEGIVFSTFYSAEAPATPEAQKFVDAFKAKYGKTPNANGALGYDTYNILVDAIRRAGSDDPKAIRDALANTVDFPAVTGSTTIDESGNATKDAVLLRVEDGKFRYLTTIKP
ncbi:MAG: ABC transporter substrate-binding protein [Bacillota bacterium]